MGAQNFMGFLVCWKMPKTKAAVTTIQEAPAPVPLVSASASGGEVPPAIANDAKPMASDESTLGDTTLRFGRCLHASATQLGYAHQDYCWLDASRITDPTAVEKIMDAWDLEPP